MSRLLTEEREEAAEVVVKEKEERQGKQSGDRHRGHLEIDLRW